jgi:hypothetical protein
MLARSQLIQTIQVGFEMIEKRGAASDALGTVRTDRCELTVAGNDWILRYGASPNLIMKRHDATVRYYETDSPDREPYRALHIQAPERLDDLIYRNPLFSVIRHGTFWFPSQARFVRKRREEVVELGPRTIDGMATYGLQWNVTSDDFDEALLVIPPRIAEELTGKLRLYVASQLGHTIPRIEYVADDGEVVKRFDTRDFVEVDDGLFFPRSTRYETRHAKERYVREYQILQVRYANQRLPDSVFAVDVPSHTRVRDSRPGVPETVFVLDQQTDFEQLDKTLVRDAAVSTWSLWRIVCLVANGLLATGLVLSWMLRRCRAQ